jgi:hypothetical protein
MKRVGFFALWTLVFWLCALFVGGQIAQVKNAAVFPPPDEPVGIRDSFEVGLKAGAHGQGEILGFVKNYWHVTLAGALLVAGVGTAAGVLPGTRAPLPKEPPPLPR